MTRKVVHYVEEWRTTGCTNRRRSYGRACFWLTLACGHHEQRMKRLERDGTVVPPRAVRCAECSA